jgi:trehalose 6-phosphate synthase
VNEKFAKALLKELPRESPLILVQDYHFALLPKMVKEARPDAKIALFWHIPWPNPEAYGICPYQKEILEGMLGSDILGFHTQYHCNNFLETVDRFLESRIDWTIFGAVRGGHTTYVKPFPISIATASDEKKIAFPEADLIALKQKYGLENKIIGVGVDRVDYTKGLLERIRSVDRFLEKYPSYQGKFVFVELGAPSRTLISSYQHHMEEVVKICDEVNQKYAKGDWKPILFLKEHHGQEIIRKFYQAADFCLVTSLHDGMNLVAKEYVMERHNNDGALILSHFAGASYQMKSALLVNPYDIEETSEAIYRALTMSREEKEERMRQLRLLVKEHNIYRWAAELVTELMRTF